MIGRFYKREMRVHQTYYLWFCKEKVRTQEMIFATHQTYYQLIVLQRKSKGPRNGFCYSSNLLPVSSSAKEK